MSVNVKKVVKIYLAIESCPEKIQEKIIIRRTFFLLLFVEKSFMKQFGVVSTTKCCFVLLKLSKEIQKLKKRILPGGSKPRTLSPKSRALPLRSETCYLEKS